MKEKGKKFWYSYCLQTNSNALKISTTSSHRMKSDHHVSRILSFWLLKHIIQFDLRLLLRSSLYPRKMKREWERFWYNYCLQTISNALISTRRQRFRFDFIQHIFDFVLHFFFYFYFTSSSHQSLSLIRFRVTFCFLLCFSLHLLFHTSSTYILLVALSSKSD